MPKSPEAAPIDFDIFGILQKHTIYTTAELKKALTDGMVNLDKTCIKNMLEIWSKHYRMI